MIPASGLERAAWGILLFIIGAFLLGTWLNRKRGRALGAWIDEGIQRMGGQPSWRFIRSLSSGAQVTVQGAAAPYRSVEAGYYLLTREIPPLYGIELLRGKRDLFSIKAGLRNPPAAEFDVAPMGGALAKELDRNAGDQPYTWIELPAGLGLATRAANSEQVAACMRPFAEKYGQSVQRLSVRQRQPNVILFLHLDGVEDHPVREIFDALRRVV